MAYLDQEYEKILRTWVATNDTDNWYRLVELEYGLTLTEAKRAVRHALHYFGLFPKTSFEYLVVRQRIRKGEDLWNELV